tara:strand:- start:426 stop:1628 length:1203 start_codon:yes stop_codon:yes gene_type:complete
MAEKQVHNVFFKTDHSSRASQISFDLPSGDGVKLSTGTGHIGLLGGGVVRIKTNQSSGVLDLGVNTLENAKPDTTILGKTFSLKAADHNANFSGKKEVDNIIYFPWNNESSDYYYGVYKVDNENSDLRYVKNIIPPEEINFSSISSGSKFFNLKSLGLINKSYNSFDHSSYIPSGQDGVSGVSGSTKFEVGFGYNDDVEKVYVTGLSGDFALISGEGVDNFTGTYPKGTKVCATDGIHPPPTGETGYARMFQVLIQTGEAGQDRFFFAGSGLEGTCGPGGSFTGSGYTFFETPVIDVYRGYTYFFNQHHASNSNEYIMFSYTSGGHHNGGVPITGKYEIEQGGSNYCFNNYCHYDCPDEQTFMIPIDTGASNKIYYYASGTAGIGGTGYLNVLVSGDGGK